jgi:hypothetical protein
MITIKQQVIQTSFPHLNSIFFTGKILFLELNPILYNHFKLLQDETVSQTLSSGMVLDEVIFVSCTFRDGSV